MSLRVSPAALFDLLHRESVPYVVLRDGNAAADPNHFTQLDDLDLLIDDEAIPMLQALGGKRGGMKVDLYGVEGRAGTGYHGFPHLPEQLGRQLLANRKQLNGIWVPTPRDELAALLYHATYHKNLQSGVHIDDEAHTADNATTRRIRRLSEHAGVRLPLTHRAFHEYLSEGGFGVSEKRLIAYVQHDFRYNRKCLFHALLQDEQPGELNLFVIRRIAVRHKQVSALTEKLRAQYDVVAQKPIPWRTRWRTAKHMRGGKWRRGGWPCVAVVVFDRNPIASTDADREVHPFVFNRRQFIKVEWRDWFATTTTARAKDNPIHSTDNEAEAWGHLPLFFDAPEIDAIRARVVLLRKQISLEHSCAR